MSNKLIDLNALSSYKTQSDLKYQDKLTAGSGISIDANNVISATGGGGGGGLAWTLIDTKTGKTAISLPSSFNELLIICKVNGLCMSISIPYQALSSTDSSWMTGGSWNGFNYNQAAMMINQASYYVSLSSVTLYRAGSGTTDASSSTVTSVYYR